MAAWLRAVCLLALVLVVASVAVAPEPQVDPRRPTIKVAFLGDQGINPNSTSVLDLIRSEGAQMVIHSGDFDYASNPAAWDAQINATLGENFPYFADVGNHDLSKWSEYQARLKERLARVTGETCSGELGVKSACSYRGLFFILSGVGTLGSDHAAFIRAQLAANEATWSVCSWHKNQKPMQVGGKANETGWEVYEACREGGAMIVTAHEHSYSRTRTLVNVTQQAVDPSWPDVSPLRVAPGATFVVVSGLGGQSIRAQTRCLPAIAPYGCAQEWASIDSATQGATFGALFCTFGTPRVDLAQCVFKNVRGEERDAFSVQSFMRQ